MAAGMGGGSIKTAAELAKKLAKQKRQEAVSTQKKQKTIQKKSDDQRQSKPAVINATTAPSQKSGPNPVRAAKNLAVNAIAKPVAKVIANKFNSTQNSNIESKPKKKILILNVSPKNGEPNGKFADRDKKNKGIVENCIKKGLKLVLKATSAKDLIKFVDNVRSLSTKAKQADFLSKNVKRIEMTGPNRNQETSNLRESKHPLIEMLMKLLSSGPKPKGPSSDNKNSATIYITSSRNSDSDNNSKKKKSRPRPGGGFDFSSFF